MAYIAPPGNDEKLRTFKLRVYNTLHAMAAATRESREMRIKQVHPDTMDAGVEKPTYDLGIGGNRVHGVHSGT